jgi:hypothetical protein
VVRGALQRRARLLLRRIAAFAVAHPKFRRVGAATLDRAPRVKALLLRSLVPEIPMLPVPVAGELVGLSPAARRYHAMLQDALKSRAAP